MERGSWMVGRLRFIGGSFMPHKLRYALLVAIALFPLVTNAQSKRVMTVDDLITTIRISDPQISPDGRRVLFTRTTTALDSGRRNSDIWAVPSDGSAP